MGGKTREGSAMKNAFLAVLLAGVIAHANAADDLRFEIAAMPELQRHAALFEQPGFGAVALESIGLSPSHSSKLVVKDGGKVVEIRYGRLRFVGRKDAVYTYEASVISGMGDGIPALTFPVVLDASALASGKTVIIVKPPLASLIPDALNDRIQTKLRAIANAGAQKQLLDHLDSLARNAKAGGGTLFEAIMLDSYNRSGGPAAGGSADIGEALPLSEQWMLILTVLIWLVAVPAAWFYRLRARRRASAPTTPA